MRDRVVEWQWVRGQFSYLSGEEMWTALSSQPGIVLAILILAPESWRRDCMYSPPCSTDFVRDFDGVTRGGYLANDASSARGRH